MKHSARVELAFVAVLLVVELVLLTIVARRNVHMLNPDAVVYLRVGQYIADGELSLALNGYWSPMLSWLLAPLIAAGVDPLIAARGVMILSALTFTSGAIFFFFCMFTKRGTRLLGSLLAAAVPIYWSVSDITPDLLSDGFLFIFFGSLFSAEWVERKGWQIAAGVAGGLAYLAKAVALPLCGATLVIVAAYLFIARLAERRQIIRALSISAIALLAISLPWIAALSVKYQKPTFSIAGPIAHALMGPDDIDRRNPLVLGFHTPEKGRVTDSESPETGKFKRWSPFASDAYFQWQLNIMKTNARKIFDYLDGLARFHVATLAFVLAVGLLFVPRFVLDQRALLGATPIAILAAAYLPIFAESGRYYLVAYPLLVACAFAVANVALKRVPIVRTVAVTAIAVTFLLPIRASFTLAWNGLPNRASTVAKQLADSMRSRHYIGSIAGMAPVDGGATGLYLAYFLGVPWHGDEDNPTFATLRASGAKYWLVGTDDRAKATPEITGALRRINDASASDREAIQLYEIP